MFCYIAQNPEVECTRKVRVGWTCALPRFSRRIIHSGKSRSTCANWKENISVSCYAYSVYVVCVEFTRVDFS